MKTQSWTTVDKSTWADGPWQSEPDKLQWVDEPTWFVVTVFRWSADRSASWSDGGSTASAALAGAMGQLKAALGGAS